MWRMRGSVQGTIQTLLVASDMIFSGSNDQATTIHVWKLDAAGQFQPQVRLPARSAS